MPLAFMTLLQRTCARGKKTNRIATMTVHIAAWLARMINRRTLLISTAIAGNKSSGESLGGGMLVCRNMLVCAVATAHYLR
jgi:hypothetical protein